MILKKNYCLCIEREYFEIKSVSLVHKIKKQGRVSKNAMIISSLNATPNNNFTLDNNKFKQIAERRGF